MALFTLSQVQAAVDAAFAATPVPPVQAASSSIADNATMRTDVYTHPKGGGFRVVANINFGSVTLQIVRNSGPDTASERTVTQAQWDAAMVAYQALRAAAYPDCRLFLDAKVHESSANPTEQAAGAAQEASYLAACMAVKAKYPKP